LLYRTGARYEYAGAEDETDEVFDPSMLWAITAYFNPSGYKSRLNNYRIFRAHLKAPLIAVELSFTGDFALRPGDAEVLVQLAGGDVLWQKERLCNVALRHLPDECDAVAWLDCDHVFGDDGWPERAGAALEEFSLVQLYSHHYNLAPGSRGDLSGWSALMNSALIDSGCFGMGCEIVAWRASAADPSACDPLVKRRGRTGGAWAASRALIEKHGFYDPCIVGGGDWAMLSAAMGKFNSAIDNMTMNEHQIEHYRSWADGFSAEVRTSVGCIEGSAFHLWHGERKDRKYTERHRGLSRFGFDPFMDVALHPDGYWCWNTNKPELHEYVRSYFDSRNEDQGL
jgi:hypothetical protein